MMLKMILTEREKQVLQRLADGLTMKQVGIALEISEKTVGGHAKAAALKLSSLTTTQAVAKAVKRNLVAVD